MCPPTHDTGFGLPIVFAVRMRLDPFPSSRNDQDIRKLEHVDGSNLQATRIVEETVEMAWNVWLPLVQWFAEQQQSTVRFKDILDPNPTTTCL